MLEFLGADPNPCQGGRLFARLAGVASVLAACAMLWSCTPARPADRLGPGTSALEIEDLRTQVGELGQTQSAMARTIETQSAEITRQSGFLSYLATAMLRRGPTFTPSPPTPVLPITGWVILEDGRCCIGGTAGQPLDLHAEFYAQSQLAPVTEMRTWLGPSPATLDDLQGVEWVPFAEQATFVIVPAINWAGVTLSVQFRDGRGTESQVASDDISVEGNP